MTVVGSRLILEAIITTKSPDDSMHVAPMGPEVDERFETWLLKPFQSSTTFSNLQRSGYCVVHIVDDSMLLAEAVLGRANRYPAKRLGDDGFVLEAACHWYALKVAEWDTSQPRAVARCEVVDHGTTKPFFGWNRAKHAVVEMAILASRVHILEHTVIANEIARYRVLVDKTAGIRERDAFELLVEYIEQADGVRQ